MLQGCSAYQHTIQVLKKKEELQDVLTTVVVLAFYPVIKEKRILKHLTEPKL